jgi:hypothetical protein
VGLNVKRIVYLTAIVPRLGESNVEAMGGEKGLPPMESTVSVLVRSSRSCIALSAISLICSGECSSPLVPGLRT